MKRAVLVPTPAFAVAGVVVALMVAVAATGGFLAGRLTAGRAEPAKAGTQGGTAISTPTKGRFASEGLIGATMSEVRSKLGAPKRIDNNGLSSQTQLADTTWVYKDGPDSMAKINDSTTVDGVTYWRDQAYIALTNAEAYFP